jgi:hypothetical protein
MLLRIIKHAPVTDTMLYCTSLFLITYMWQCKISIAKHTTSFIIVKYGKFLQTQYGIIINVQNTWHRNMKTIYSLCSITLFTMELSTNEPNLITTITAILIKIITSCFYFIHKKLHTVHQVACFIYKLTHHIPASILGDLH